MPRSSSQSSALVSTRRAMCLGREAGSASRRGTVRIFEWRHMLQRRDPDDSSHTHTLARRDRDGTVGGAEGEDGGTRYVCALRGRHGGADAGRQAASEQTTQAVRVCAAVHVGVQAAQRGGGVAWAFNECDASFVDVRGRVSDHARRDDQGHRWSRFLRHAQGANHREYSEGVRAD
jgi:hypothetical protein